MAKAVVAAVFTRSPGDRKARQSGWADLLSPSSLGIGRRCHAVAIGADELASLAQAGRVYMR
eukprot:4292282-Prorocentrum_lima.AAC.1